MKCEMRVMTAVLCMAAAFGRADSYWGGASGNYTNPASWQAGGVPMSADQAFFTNEAAYTVAFTANWTNHSASFERPNQMVTLDIGSGRTWRLADQFRVGYAGKVGRATLSSGTLFAVGNVEVGYGATAGSGSANNRLVVTNGASVYSSRLGVGWYGPASEADNIVHVSGPGTTWFLDRGSLNLGNIGNTRGNVVKISNGAHMAVRSNNWVYVGNWAGSSNNQLIVEGAGTRFEIATWNANCQFNGKNNNQLIIRDGAHFVVRDADPTVNHNVYFTGDSGFKMFVQSGGIYSNMVIGNSGSPNFNGTSRLEVSSGGRLNTGGSYTYFTDDAQYIVTGPGAHVTGNNAIFRKRSYFEVSNGASNLFPRTFIGDTVGDDARMLLTGAGSYSGGELYVQAGRGRVTIADGAFYKVGRFNVAVNAGSTGIVDVTGANSRFESLHATINNIGQSGLCTLTVTNGGKLTAPSLKIGMNADAAGSELRLYDGTIVCAGIVSNIYGKISIRGTGGVFAPGKVVASPWSELEFIAGAAGVSPMRPGTLTVSSGASLTIDASAWSPEKTVVTNVVTYTSMPTPFDANQITVTVEPGASWSIDQGSGANSAIALTLVPPSKGTVISLY